MKGMAVLIDTNVIIDYLLTREPHFESSSKIMEKCAARELKGYIAFHSVPNLWYILRKIPEDKRREWLMDICEFLETAGVNHNQVLRAIQMEKFKDFEDCLQDRCAVSVGAKYIITRNTEDFTESQVPAISPESFLNCILTDCGHIC
ncbi:MAG: PIN domain-containing protein [Eubacterium sp.]|jgi:predicted nucleic acid-binding protein|nr:PIN domain-containing protein [Eubacterium sp.]